MTHTKDSLKAAYGTHYAAYDHLKQQHPGFKLRRLSWAAIVAAFNCPPPPPQPDLSWVLDPATEWTPKLLCEIAEGKHGAAAQMLFDAGFRFAKVGLALALNEPMPAAPALALN